MTERCPTCSQPWSPSETDAPTPTSVEDLIAECRKRNITVLTANRVREDGTAILLDRSQETLRGWRKSDHRLPFARDGAKRITYGLADISKFLNFGGENR